MEYTMNLINKKLKNYQNQLALDANFIAEE